ncbi:MAG TPA: hypothetical protein VN624_03545 [Rhodanobacter sp.]|nr:hypothetical protein [Rhodanobacter sp.]
MTIWIGTNQVGWDGVSIAFHSIQGCTGLVLMTTHWVAGWHVGGGGGTGLMYNNQSKISFQGAAFLNYIRAINPNPWPAGGMPAGPVKLWNIHNGHADWKTEIADFAALIGYHGATRGFDLRSKIGAIDSCDIVITKVGDDCQIKYKRTNKMNHTQQNALQMTQTPVRMICGTVNILPATRINLNAETHSATVVPTKSNSGQMHRAGCTSLKKHDV